MSSNSNGFANGADSALACIFSLKGTKLTEREIVLFRRANPFGFILFKRNCENPEQLKSLINNLKEIVGRNCPILIDQEGGRVERLSPPHWRGFKPMLHFGDLYRDDPDKALDELRFETLRLADELVDLGINVNCAPVLDLYFDGAHDIIGDRAFSCDADIVTRLGLSVCRNFLKSGITPIVKHVPGHGRSSSDSHLELPIIDASYEDLSKLDFAPFRDISSSDIGHNIWAMTAHIVFSVLDTKRLVSVSPNIIKDIIRGEIGFDGILIGDDLDMKAMDSYGNVSDKAITSLNAGCDLALYCGGDIDKMVELADNLPKISNNAMERLLYG